MRLTIVLCVLHLLAGAAPATETGRQDSPTSAEMLELIRALNERIENLEAARQADQQRIQELEKKLSHLEPKSLEEEPRAGALSPPPPEEARPPRWLDLSPDRAGAPNLLNPQITVFFDGGGSISSRGRNEALNRFNLREVEIDLRAAISPQADGVLIVTLEEEIEQEPDGSVDIDREVDIEEGYIDFHTLPYDLTFRVGKFRNLFGRNNLLHTHDLPQVTRPLAVENFLGPEGLITVGASLSWLVPNPWDKYIETTVQVVNADGGEESPILGGPNAENPAVLGHIKFFDDITDTSWFEIGGTYLFGRTSANSDFDANVFGLDLTYQWVDPDPAKFRSLLLQSELFWADNDVDGGFFGTRRNDSFGAYAFAQYQFDRDWYVGLRGDYTEFPNSETRGSKDYDVAISPYLTWYISEFLRARLEYQHRIFNVRGRGTSSEEAVFLQFTGVFGAHPPHPYWVQR